MSSVQKNLYNNFNPYSYYQSLNPKTKKKDLKPLIGAFCGVGAGLLANYKLFGKNEKFLEFLKSETEKPVKIEALQLIIMSLLANIGGVLGGSIDAKKETIPKKWKEAAFQTMNMAIPMILVSSFIVLTKKVEFLSKLPIKIGGSFAAMITGAMIATGITNLTRPKNTPKRQYTIRDSVANIDDIVATIKLGFREVEKYIPIHYMLPFIYAYCGMRAGEKE